MTKKETIQVLQSIEDRAVDFPYMTACDWVAIAAAKRHLENSLEVKDVQEEPVSEDLEEAANNYVGHAPEIDEDLSCFTKRNAFIAGAKWGMEQAEVKIQAQSIAVAHGCPKESLSNDLEEAAKKAGQKYFPDKDNIWARPNYEAMAAENAFKEGAQWQEEQCQKTIELAEDHAYLAGQEKMINKACNWLADNYSKYIITNGLATIFSATIDFDTIRMIEDFKKAMKE